MNWNILTIELLKAMRAKRSQTYINKKLGYSFNQVSRWETGRSQISWKDFVRLATVCRIDLNQGFKRTFSYLDSPLRLDLLIRHLSGNSRIISLSSHLGISRHILGRWISGKSSPSLKNILYVIDSLTPLLIEFLETFIEVDKIPSLSILHEHKKLEKKMNYQYPFLGAVLRCLELDEYKSLNHHEVGYISKTIGISLDQEKSLIKDLINLDIIKLQNNKLVPKENRIDTRGDFSGQMNIRKYWLQRSLEFIDDLKQPPDNSYMGYLVFNVSQKAKYELKKRYFDFFQEVRNIIEMDNSNADDIYLLNIQLCSLADLVSKDNKK